MAKTDISRSVFLNAITAQFVINSLLQEMPILKKRNVPRSKVRTTAIKGMVCRKIFFEISLSTLHLSNPYPAKIARENVVSTKILDGRLVAMTGIGREKKSFGRNQLSVESMVISIDIKKNNRMSFLRLCPFKKAIYAKKHGMIPILATVSI